MATLKDKLDWALRPLGAVFTLDESLELIDLLNESSQEVISEWGGVRGGRNRFRRKNIPELKPASESKPQAQFKPWECSGCGKTEIFKDNGKLRCRQCGTEVPEEAQAQIQPGPTQPGGLDLSRDIPKEDGGDLNNPETAATLQANEEVRGIIEKMMATYPRANAELQKRLDYMRENKFTPKQEYLAFRKWAMHDKGVLKTLVARKNHCAEEFNLCRAWAKSLMRALNIKPAEPPAKTNA